jgi:hypothetical protein
MDQELAEELARQLNISLEHVVREEIESSDGNCASIFPETIGVIE